MESPPWSRFGSALSARSGIEELMEDLGHALADGGEHIQMLGGGNPAHVPAAEALWKERLDEILADPKILRRTLAIYDPPRGNPKFLDAIADLLNSLYGWNIDPSHLAVTPGSQTAFFFLFQLLGGRSDHSLRRILFPVMPEYIGYAAQETEPGMFHGMMPKITKTGAHAFKYHVDFGDLAVDEETAAICISRPTNPSGNVLEDDEVLELSRIAARAGVPFVIDNAYGLPFPGILFKETKPLWAPHHVFVFSLSKLGLPGTRTAVVVAAPEIASAITSMNAATGLANGNFGQAITLPLLRDGRLLDLVEKEIHPFYESKMRHAREVAEQEFPADLPWRLHETEGALFLWLWLEDCPVPSREMYRRLKEQHTLVVPGDPFFFGLGESSNDWQHQRQCLRISYAMDRNTVENGLRGIAREITRAYSE